MVIQSRRVWSGDAFTAAQIRTEDGKISALLPYGTLPADRDFNDARIVPGFIDLHTHGCDGFDTMDATAEGLRAWAKALPGEGVTAFCPTTLTAAPAALSAALKNVAEVAGSAYEGAEILGVHLEGPFLNETYCGAQAKEYIAPPDIERFKQYQADAAGLIRIITLACEKDRAYALTAYCRAQGVLVSQGHSGVSYEEALEAIAHGAMSVTHSFNAMSAFHHRSPGLAGAAMRAEDCYSEIICDGRHVHPAVLFAFFQTKDKDRVIMVSDSLAAKGCPAGTKLRFGTAEIEVRTDGLAYLRGTDTIAGSTLRINEGLRLLVEEAGVPFDRALVSCTRNPAAALGLQERKGRIAKGFDADLVVLGDDYSVLNTFIKGLS